MNRLIIPAILALTLGVSGVIARFVRSDSGQRPIPTADTLRGARP